MPTSAELIAAVADATGFPFPTVATYYRGLRGDQLVGEGGRGRNALALGLTDATKLLVATLTSGEAREAPAAVETTYALKGRLLEVPKAKPYPHFPNALKPTFFARLCHRLPRPAYFGPTLDAMMAAIAADRFAPLPGADDVAYSSPAGNVKQVGEKGRANRAGDPQAWLELRAVLRRGQFVVAGATLSFGRLGIYKVSIGFSNDTGSAFSASALEREGTVAGRRLVGLPALKRLVAHFPNEPTD